MKIDDLTFPVLSMSGNVMLSAKTADELARGTRKAVTQGYFDKIVVTDSDGNRVQVSGARPQANRNPAVLLAWFLGFPVTLLFDSIEPLPEVELSEFKETVKKQLSKDRGFWSSVGVGYAGLQEAVRSASSFKQVVLLFV